MNIEHIKDGYGEVVPVIKYNPYPYDPKEGNRSLSKILAQAVISNRHLVNESVFEDHIAQWDNKVLKQTSTPVDTVTDNLKYLIASLKKTLYFYNAAGISAPQIGVNTRVIVINNTLNFKNTSETDTLVLINPEIISDYSEEELVNGMEGCLSFPESFVAVLRPKTIKVRYKDVDWNELETVFYNDQAREILHEVDHLDGKLLIDNVSKLKRNLILDKLKKLYTSGNIFNDIIALDALKKLRGLTNEQ